MAGKRVRRAARTREVVLAMGTEILRVKVRGLSLQETIHIENAFEAPVPPKKMDPKGGSLAMVPDKDDPKYVKELARYYLKQHVASVAVAAGIVLEDGREFDGAKTDAEIKSWIEQAVVEVSADYSNTEIELMAVAMRMVSGGETLKENVHQLIVEVPKKAVAVGGDDEFADEIGRGPKDPLELPANYARTEDGLMMRASRSFGRDPFKWPLTLSADERVKVLADQILFEREESEHRLHVRMIAEASVRT